MNILIVLWHLSRTEHDVRARDGILEGTSTQEKHFVSFITARITATRTKDALDLLPSPFRPGGVDLASTRSTRTSLAIEARRTRGPSQRQRRNSIAQRRTHEWWRTPVRLLLDLLCHGSQQVIVSSTYRSDNPVLPFLGSAAVLWRYRNRRTVSIRQDTASKPAGEVQLLQGPQGAMGATSSTGHSR